MQKGCDPHSFFAHSVFIFFRKSRLLRGIAGEFQGAVEQMIQVDFFTDDLLRGCRLARLQEIPPADFMGKISPAWATPGHCPPSRHAPLRAPKPPKPASARRLRARPFGRNPT